MISGMDLIYVIIMIFVPELGVANGNPLLESLPQLRHAYWNIIYLAC